jgi:ribosomal protein S8
LNNNFVKIYLKFDNLGNSLIKTILPISTLGRKKYIKINSLKKISLKKNNFYLLNTSKGILNYKESLNQKVGGELLFKISI